MKRSVSLADAKAHLSALVNEVAFGKGRIVLLSRGKAKAALIGVDDFKRLEGGLVVSTAVEVLKKAEKLRNKIAGRKKKLTSTDEILASIREGRVR